MFEDILGLSDGVLDLEGRVYTLLLRLYRKNVNSLNEFYLSIYKKITVIQFDCNHI